MRMDRDVRDRLDVLGAVEGVFALRDHEGTRLIGITLNAKRDIAKLMWAESCGEFWFKQVKDKVDAAFELGKLRKRMPGVRVWEAKPRAKPVPEYDWSGKGIHGLDKKGPIGWIK